MNAYAAMPLWILLTSLLASVVIFALGEARRRARITVNLTAASGKLVLVAVMLFGVGEGHDFGFRAGLAPGLELALHADALTMLLMTLSAVLWLLTTVYAIGYLEDSPHRCRFFGFFSLCVAATSGASAAANLFTFLVFFELLTVSTWPLVVHRGTPEVMAAGRKYLVYLLTGGALLLAGTIGVHAIAGPGDFVPGGYLSGDEAPRAVLVALFLLMFLGIGVKTAMFPLHAWLPAAMVAPAPVSALLHAVAVVKVGAFGIARLVYDVFGFELTARLHMHHVVAGVAAFTILYGSARALTADHLKQRLAWSTVSQVSYIALGIGIGGIPATVGGLVHLVHQGLMKITLFFCAGNLSETHGIHRVSEMDGAGRTMPWTMAAFTTAAFGLIGVPPLAGFVTKWYLGLGGVAGGHHWVVGVLVASTLLNAAYFLPILRRAWFAAPPSDRAAQAEAAPALLVPALLTAALSLGAGFLAGMPYSPLQWVLFITERFYG